MSQSNARSRNYITQLKGSVFFKCGAILATFLAMPIMIKYLGVEQFGIWSTMLTLIGWVMMFDFGIGNGLKNKISESLARNDTQKAAGFISTAYGLIGFISIFLFFTFFSISYYIPWQRVFNTQIISDDELRYAAVALSFFVFSNFWISLVNQIYHGLQKSSFVTFGQFVSNVLALVFVVILYYFYDTSLIKMVIVYGFALLLSNGLLSFLIFSSNVNLKPNLKSFDSKKVYSLLSLGVKFFVIQLAVIVIFMTDKIIITQLLGPENVTPYEVVFKLFSVFTILHSLILLPIWPAYSNAYAQGDFSWIRATLKQQIKIAFALFFGASLLSFLGPTIVSVWIGSDLMLDETLYIFFFGFIVVSVWSNVFAYFVNSVNKINVQLFTSVIAAVINIPMSIYFVSNLDMGLNGIVLATTISLSIYALIGPFQVLRILR